MAGWSIFQSADWNSTSGFGIPFDDSRYAPARSIGIDTRLDRNLVLPPDQICEKISLNDESKKLVDLKQQYEELKQKEKDLNLHIDKTSQSLTQYVEISTKIRNSFTELSLLLGGCQDLKLEDLNELTALQGKYIEKMKEFEKIYMKNMTGLQDKLKDDLQITTENLSIYRELLHGFVKDLIPEDKRKTNICSICYEHDINRCLNPCGHGYCEGCSKNLTGNCPTCRTKISTVIPLFL